jgi:hypothetical protein
MKPTQIKQITLALLIIITGLALFVESKAGDSFLYFLLVGAIPGTSYTIPSGLMLFCILAIVAFIILRSAGARTLYAVVAKRTTKVPTRSKKRLSRSQA